MRLAYHILEAHQISQENNEKILSQNFKYNFLQTFAELCFMDL